MDFRLLRHLWYFLAVAQEKHFGRAAQRLGISQPPLSQQIKVLERVLGIELFERSRSGVYLTPAGEAVLPAIEQLMDQAQRVENMVFEAKQGRAQGITVGAITSALFNPLADILKEVKVQMPDIAISLIEMDTADALLALEEKRIDVAFARIDKSFGDIEVKPLTTNKLVAALPLSHPLSLKQSLCLADLAGEAMVTFPRRVSPAYFDSIIVACREAGFSPRMVHEVTSVVAQVAFVACGAGVALVPNSMVRLNASSVVFRPLEDDIKVVTTAVAWNRTRVSSRVIAFIELAKYVDQENP